MATIQKRVQQDGKVAYHVRIRRKGHPLQCGTFTTISRAKEFVQRTEAAMKEGRYLKTVEAKKHTLAELIERYVRDILPRKPKSNRQQLMQLKWWKEQLGYRILSDLSPSIIAEYRDKLSREKTTTGEVRSPSTVVRYLAVLSHALSIAVKEWEWLDDTPMRKVSKPREPRGRVRYLSDDERMRLLEACKGGANEQIYVVVVLALSTGMRQGEILNLTWKDVDLEKQRIILQETKNGECRAVPLSGHILELLSNLSRRKASENSLVFPGQDPRKPLDIRFSWEKALKDAMITDFRFHDLRHTFASYLAMRKATLTELRNLLGHKSASMTARYSHLSEAHGAAVVSDMTRDIFDKEPQTQGLYEKEANGRCSAIRSE